MIWSTTIIIYFVSFNKTGFRQHIYIHSQKMLLIQNLKAVLLIFKISIVRMTDKDHHACEHLRLNVNKINGNYGAINEYPSHTQGVKRFERRKNNHIYDDVNCDLIIGFT